MAQIGMLLAVGVVAAAAIYFRLSSQPQLGGRADDPPRITVARATHGPPPVLWVDARSDSDFRAGHVPEAISLNEDDWEAGLARLVRDWRPECLVVVYCSGDRCDAADRVARRLRADLAISDVSVLAGGWQEWLRARK